MNSYFSPRFGNRSDVLVPFASCHAAPRHHAAPRGFVTSLHRVLLPCAVGFCFCFGGAHLEAAPLHPTAHDEGNDATAQTMDEPTSRTTNSDSQDLAIPATTPAKQRDSQSAKSPANDAFGAKTEATARSPMKPLESNVAAPDDAVVEAVDEPQARDGESLRQAALRLKLPLPLPQGRIVVWKAKRRLELWNGNSLIKTYRVALGATPQGHKRRQGDKRTPEGEFHICTRNASTSAFHIFLGLDYPAVPDATRALKDKTISWREYQAIRSRLASRSAPLWGTRLGGWVGIHGGSDGPFARKRAKQRGGGDWTAGCIALRDREIEELYAATRLGTSVSVRP